MPGLKQFCVLLMTLCIPQAALAQPDPPVLRATSPSVDVQDGDRLWKGAWTADPAAALDIYNASRTAAPKRVTFITDIDSMSFDVEPGRTYDFIILLNAKDACHTRISTMMQSFERLRPDSAAGPVEIPITISHGKLHLQGTINASKTLDLIFDTGADTNVLYPSGVTRGAILQFDGATTNAGTGGVTLRQTSSDNQLEIAGLRWRHEPVMFIEKQADIADAIVGYRVFEDKIVEIDYDRMVMIIHDALPAYAPGFHKTPMPFAGSLTAIEAGLSTASTQSSGFFLLDTGGAATLIVNQAFATDHALRASMQKIGSSVSRGVGSAAIRNDVLLLPSLTIAGFTLQSVPIDVELPSDSNKAPPGGALCVEVLKRFNTILDYPRNGAYLKPNTLFDTPFEKRSSGRRTAVITGVTAAIVASLLAGAWRRKNAKGSALTPEPASG